MQSLFNHTLISCIGLQPKDRILVGVSGGVDSVVLLDLLWQAAGKLQLEIRAAHLDHCMRSESCRDAEFVRELCLRLQVPLSLGCIDVPTLAAQRKRGLEEAARDARRDFLLRTARLEGCRFVALGHHRDDQAETFMHRLLRGSSLSGLACMRLRSDPFIRPLLTFSRSDILQYRDSRQLGHVEDLSNADPSFTRNRLRHELLPLLREYNPRIDHHLAALSRRIAVEEDYWEQQVGDAMASLCVAGDDGLWLCCNALELLHPALRLRVLRAALERLRGDLRGIGAPHLEALQNLLHGARPEAEVHLPGAWAARRYDRLWMRTTPPLPRQGFAVAIPGPGVYDFPGGGQLHVTLQADCGGETRWVAEFDAALVRFPLQVRSFRPGDRFYPSGAPGHRKLKDFFIDAKLPREVRQALPLVVADEIIWLPGLRRCQGLRPKPGGSQVLRLAVTGRSGDNQGL
ncbi:MAG: tRNA lysidine(34) synthetase TilS [Syntrophotalea acetylenica]|jgi:tRNA(Ile)-lysidine synthase|uniref:tRNA(Ile)-lysidine synthase n=1 Tax=Syntrophotalea acetylenica TaxID=29542 RepID=A0A1L3GD77_SYNAC|nr:tRNA lysidine(34) synthetase TilS [Syntrophotalea acetylenica]APG23901.1 tRNA lysidine(34) synthetase TilS [Syntrophotalea acetylenica]APG44482.1 hypothetical protein A6070_10450 [Syntrophotalea acetylenica]MDD4457028.1 tRNA lysidine(34) synthetase TilS [Syntrophotalea acetylenica]MDY0263392.1 tRNA lysidine(34) synthetase TilS [Syntrophotalea acetylenica]